MLASKKILRVLLDENTRKIPSCFPEQIYFPFTRHLATALHNLTICIKQYNAEAVGINMKALVE